ncbi:MAG: DUF3656 domain-containing protein, partial [Candidatus Saccharimonas sp.]|nr:DUF3656 domain-containing protein [Planctomycetaceae bacterium]
TKHYRAAIDAAVKGEPVEFTRDEVREMELSFSRGFSPGWLNGDDHKMLVPGFSSSKRGVLLGEIVRVRDASVDVRLAGPVARGDGVVFEGDREANAEQGGRIFGILQRSRSLESAEGGVVELEFQRGAIEFDRLNAGQSIWKTDDPQLTARLRKTFTGPDPLRKRPLDLRVRCVSGEPLMIVGQVSNLPVSVTSPEPLPVATKHAITAEFLREQLSRLGNTVYELRHLDAEIIGGPMVPLSVLSKLRQEFVARLDEVTKQPRQRTLFDGYALGSLRAGIANGGSALLPFRSSSQRTEGTPGTQKTDGQECPASEAAARLHVLCRTLDQLRAIASSHSELRTPNSALLYADFQDIREYRDAVVIAHEAGLPIYLATTRIQKPDEVGFFHALLKQGADGILVRNLAGMRFYADEGVPFVADYSLNATNELTAQFLIEQRAQRVTASYDMNRDQLLGLVDAVPPEWLEVVVHQHMPMFHMEHCVFCAVLSPGTNKHNCGRPCDTHLVQLRDRVGSEHPLHADVGCRNTLFNAVPQSGAEVVASL